MRKSAPDTAPDTTDGDGEMSKSAVLLLFIGLMMAMFMFALNQNMLATALPTIVGELGGVDLQLWVSTAFMLASTIVMPIYGKVGDLFGRKKLFLFAIAIFMVGAVCGLVAQDMRFIILGRVLQGIGGGGLLILSQAIIASVVPARQRGKYMGIMGSVFAVCSVAGPLVGGWLTEGPGWRWAFVINFPLGLCAILAAVVFLKIPKTRYETRPKVDVGGMMLIGSFTSSLILVTAWGGAQYAWTSPVILGLVAVCLVSALAFVFVEAKVSEPVIPMDLFRQRNFVFSTLSGMLIAVSMFGVIAYMPTYLQMVHGMSATAAGFMMIPQMGFMLVSSTIIGFVVARTGRYKIYPVLGVVFVLAAMTWLSMLGPHSGILVTIAPMALLGLGFGFSQQMLVLIVQNAFPVAVVGTATAASNFFRQIGSTLGMSVIGALFTSRLMANLHDSVPAGAAEVEPSSLTPELVGGLPGDLHEAVITSYNDALLPLYLWIVPVTAIGLLSALLIKEVPLATKIDRRPPTRATITEEETPDPIGEQDPAPEAPSAPGAPEGGAAPGTGRARAQGTSAVGEGGGKLPAVGEGGGKLPAAGDEKVDSHTGVVPTVRSTSDDGITATAGSLAATGQAPLDTVVRRTGTADQHAASRDDDRAAADPEDPTDDRIPARSAGRRGD